MNTRPDINKIRDCLSRTIRSYLAGLAFECPFGGGNPKFCICHALREKPKKERARMLAALTDEECLKIFDQHRKCFAEKSLSLARKKRASPAKANSRRTPRGKHGTRRSAKTGHPARA